MVSDQGPALEANPSDGSAARQPRTYLLGSFLFGHSLTGGITLTCLFLTLSSIRFRRANTQYVAMTEGEVWRFLASKDRIFVAFATRRGFPHVTPMWFCVLDGRIYLRTQDYKVKVRLARVGKVCCSIDEGKRYRELRGVTIWGRSRVVTENALIRSASRAMDARYRSLQWKESEMPQKWVADRKLERRAYIEIIPEKISSWDNRKVV